MTFIENLNLTQVSKKTVIYLILPFIVLLIIFPVTVQPGQVFISEYHDTMALTIPDLFLMQHPLSLWDFNWLTGMPDISSLETDRFYPLSFPFFFFFQNIFVINLILLINLYIAYLGFFKLGSLLVKNEDLLMIFSMGYMLSGTLISRVFIGHISFVYAMAWIPLIYYFFLKICLNFDRDHQTLNMLGLAITETLLFFTGAMYYLFFCNIILILFFGYYLISHRLNKQIFFILCGAAGLAFLLSAIKLIPNLVGMQYIQRIDIINPLGDGGLLENNIAAFVAGTPIDSVFGSYETMALIGVIPVFFAILALIWGRKEITIPSFIVIIFAFMWADGGRTFLSFIHLFPVINGFRNAGRIFGAIMPLVLLLAIYGISLLQQKIKNNESLVLSEDRKKNIIFGIVILGLLKISELPWSGLPSLESTISVILVLGLIVLLYLNKTTVMTLSAYFSVALLIDLALISKNFNFLSWPLLIKGGIIVCIIGGSLICLNWQSLTKTWLKLHIFEGLLLIAILVSIVGNISVLQTSDPHLSDSQANSVIEKIQEDAQNTPQIWVYEVGWPVQHLDFTYWLIINNIHPMRAYYSYIPSTEVPPIIKIGNTDYFTANYIIDTAYLENGNQNIDVVSFKVNNISIYKPENVLPNAFVLRNNQLIPSKIEKFSPDEVVLSGLFLKGDLAILKTSYFPGWTVNGQDASNAGNMNGAVLGKDTTTITFRFDPITVKIGGLLTLSGIIIVIVILVRRKDIEKNLVNLEVPPKASKNKKRYNQ